MEPVVNRWPQTGSMRYTKGMTTRSKRPSALRFDPNSLEWIGLRLTVVSSRYMAPINAELEQHQGVSRDDVTVTICLSITNATSAQEIVRYTGRPKNSVSRAVTSLEERGFLRRYTDASDRRSSKLSLTPRGRKLADQIAARFVQRDNLLLHPLSEQERRGFNRLLNKISAPSPDWP
jgi:DNA-binding MarR family transcriptional regulator